MSKTPVTGGRKPARYTFRWWHVHVPLVVIAVVIAAVLLIGGGTAYNAYKVRGAHGTVTLPTPPPKVAAQTAVGLDTHKNARDETPAGAPAKDLRAIATQDANLAKRDQLPRHFPDAAPSQRGCTTRLVVNFSSRNGVAPHAWVLHYTVSSNVFGWADNNSVVGIFNTPSYQASSNYVYDAEGHCYYIVREVDKAWTQAAANPYSISVEVIDTGHEKTYLPAPALRKLAMIISDSAYRWHIPIQLGAVSSNGTLTRYGILDHGMLGIAGGGHHDIAPIVGNGFDYAAGVARTRQVISAVKAYRASLVPKKPTRAVLRATARKAVLALRASGETWTQIKATAAWRLYVKDGGR